MSLDLTAIRVAIAAAVATASGLPAFAFVPDSVNPPVAIVGPDRSTYLTFDTVTGTPDHANFLVSFIIARTDAAAGQKALDDLLKVGTIWTAFVADPTLGGLVAYAVFTEARNPGPVLYADQPYYGVDLAVEVGL